MIRDLPTGMVGWEQLTLFQPEAVSVEMIVHLSDRGRYIDGGVRATDTMSGAVLHVEALHWQPTLSGLAEAVVRYHKAAHYWAGVVWSPGDPSRGGESA